MGIVGPFFVTPHAVHQFQRRIASLSYEQALAAILHGLTSPGRQCKCLPSGSRQTVVRVKQPYPFRAIIDARQTTAEKPLPAVVTILKG